MQGDEIWDKGSGSNHLIWLRSTLQPQKGWIRPIFQFFIPDINTLWQDERGSTLTSCWSLCPYRLEVTIRVKKKNALLSYCRSCASEYAHVHAYVSVHTLMSQCCMTFMHPDSRKMQQCIFLNTYMCSGPTQMWRHVWFHSAWCKLEDANDRLSPSPSLSGRNALRDKMERLQQSTSFSSSSSSNNTQECRRKYKTQVFLWKRKKNPCKNPPHGPLCAPASTCTSSFVSFLFSTWNRPIEPSSELACDQRIVYQQPTCILIAQSV